MPEKLLSEADARKLMLSCAAGTESGATQTDMQKVIAWAEQVVVDHGLLEMVLKGEKKCPARPVAS